MIVDVILHAGAITPERVLGRNVAVIDVFRATSVIVEALHNGASAVIPVLTPEDALSMCEKFGKPKTVLGGERKLMKVDGFDLGNSPSSYTPEIVGGKTVILSTTNGTRAILSSRGAKTLYIASFLNMGAVCSKLTVDHREVVLVCSGRLDRFTTEDGLCAGAMVGTLSVKYGYKPTEIADVMRDLYINSASDIRKKLSTTAHFNDLIAAGLGNDIDFCLQRDIYDHTPLYVSHGDIKLQP